MGKIVFSSRRRHTRYWRDWSSDVCSSDLKAHQRLVNPKNKLKLDVIVVGTGLAGASAAASLGEMGFNVYNFCIQDSPRRAHSIAAQGGINAAKNYRSEERRVGKECRSRWSPY